MPGLLTEITEIVTGLGMLGFDTLEAALDSRPQRMRNVTAAHWERLEIAMNEGSHQPAFEAAWANGQAFLESADGLRGRLPIIIEWKGGHQPPGFDLIPADLRVDHVYLVSCKYQSKILSNSSPSNLFDRRLADRTAGPGQERWYAVCAPEAYEHFYSCVRRYVGQGLLPATPHELTAAHLRRIRRACAVTWPAILAPLWAEFSLVVASASAERWLAQLATPARREEMVWRLLRLSPADDDPVATGRQLGQAATTPRFTEHLTVTGSSYDSADAAGRWRDPGAIQNVLSRAARMPAPGASDPLRSTAWELSQAHYCPAERAVQISGRVSPCGERGPVRRTARRERETGFRWTNVARLARSGGLKDRG